MEKQKYRRVEVYVKQSDISRGKRGHAKTCAIARAMRRAEVFGRDVHVYGPEAQTARFGRIPLPWKCEDFVSGFDRGEPVKPFSFSVRIPVEPITESA